jgi:hypothetical protein
MVPFSFPTLFAAGLLIVQEPKLPSEFGGLRSSITGHPYPMELRYYEPPFSPTVSFGF